MIFELSTDNVLAIASGIGLIVSSIFSLWMRSVSAQNKELKKELDETEETILLYVEENESIKNQLSK